jgi:hypothetical protein
MILKVCLERKSDGLVVAMSLSLKGDEIRRASVTSLIPASFQGRFHAALSLDPSTSIARVSASIHCKSISFNQLLVHDCS